jgi:hypothetical protein
MSGNGMMAAVAWLICAAGVPGAAPAMAQTGAGMPPGVTTDPEAVRLEAGELRRLAGVTAASIAAAMRRNPSAYADLDGLADRILAHQADRRVRSARYSRSSMSDARRARSYGFSSTGWPVEWRNPLVEAVTVSPVAKTTRRARSGSVSRN